MTFNKKTVFIVLFAILYLAVGLVSTIHAVSFFGLANNQILGIILAITFEIGQAAVLFNLLTSPSQRKRFMPWALMCILTLVQILGNIFSSYKYLITNSTGDLRYFKEPIFIWTDLPDEQCNVIITYIVGAILPIVALCLTEMVVSYLGNEDENINISNEHDNIEHDTELPKKQVDDKIDIKLPPITADLIEQVNNEMIDEYERKSNTENETTQKQNEYLVETNSIKESDETEDITENIEQEVSQNTDTEDTENIEQEVSQNTDTEDNTEVDVKNEPEISSDTVKAVDELLQGSIKQDGLNIPIKPSKQSHFINI